MDLSGHEKRFTHKKKKWIPWYFLTLLVCGIEVWVLTKLGWQIPLLMNNVLLVMFLMLVFGFLFCFVVRERLPQYYDENKISYFSDGFLRMHMPGVAFNNRNWPYILKAVRVMTMVTAVSYPLLFIVLTFFVEKDKLFVSSLPLTLAFALGGFIIPIYTAAWKHK